MKKYYYTYKILFDTGHYYYGSRSCDVSPEMDSNYVGSPVTNKEYWEKYSYIKEVIQTYDSSLEVADGEKTLIGNLHKTDPLCLNEHNALNFDSRGRKWWYNGDRVMYSNTSPGEEWKHGRPEISNIQQGKKRLDVSNALRGKSKTEEHKRALSESKQKIAHLYRGDNNVMKRDDVREKHRKILDSPEYRKKVSDGVRNSDRWCDKKTKEHSDMMSVRFTENNPSAKKVVINGVEYKSIVDAMKATGMTRQKILKKYF